MKTMFSIIPIILLLGTAHYTKQMNASNVHNSGEETVLLENNDVIYSAIEKEDLSEFIKVQYIKSEKDIYIETRRVVSFLEVADTEGKPLYKLPIDTKKIHLATKDLDKGKYTVKLRLKGENKYIQTILKKI